MNNKILLIGSGAREHAMGEGLAKSEGVHLFVWAGSKNPGLLKIAEELRIGKMDDVSGIVSYAQERAVDFVVVGPELPLSVGVVDALSEIGISSVGPTKVAARLETSKGFTRDLLVDAGIDVCPKFKRIVFNPHLTSTFQEEEVAIPPSERGALTARGADNEWGREVTTEMREWVESLGEGIGFVVKPDGLTGGKGVRVQGDHFDTVEEGLAYAQECLEADGSVLLEEKLIGQEFSLMSFCDGEHLAHMPVVQDNKRLLPGDMGPNTGGMGSVSDASHNLPFLGVHDILEAQAVNEKVAAAMLERGMAYKGILYGNFIAVKGGVKIIEYNARFGDPEAMNIMSILESDFVEICRGIVHGNLDEKEVVFSRKATVCKYVVPEGYPENPVKDVKVDVGANGGSPDSNVNIFYAAIDQREDGLYLTGSRAIGVVGVASTMRETERLAEAVIQKIDGQVVHRDDIGTEALLSKRVDMMREVRD